MKEQNIDSLIDELLGGAKVEAPVETSITKEASEPTTRNTVPKVTTNGITVVYDTPEPQSQNADPKEENKDKATEFLSKSAEMGLEEAQADLEEMRNGLDSKVQNNDASPNNRNVSEPEMEQKTEDRETNKSVYIENDGYCFNKYGKWLYVSLFLRNIENYDPFKTFIKSDRYGFEPLGYKLKCTLHGSCINIIKEDNLYCSRDDKNHTNITIYKSFDITMVR